tara:strand:+ start:139 stop:813 length:675 start_codon:yes stop_codon:yes gene_type:complete
MKALGNYKTIFELLQVESDATGGHASGWTACLEFRLGSLSYNPGGAAEYILFRWGGKQIEAHVIASVVVTPGTSSSQTTASFRAALVNGDADSTVTFDLSPQPDTTDTVYKVAVAVGGNVSSGTPSASQNKLVVRYIHHTSGAVTAGGTALLSGATSAADFHVDSDGEHSDLTLLGARSRANVSAEANNGGTEGQGARPVLSNFLLYSTFVTDSDLLNILGKDI